MRSRTRLITMAIAAAAIAATGCTTTAGRTARESLLPPVAREQWWPLVKEHAEYGVAAKVRDGRLGENGEALARETIRQMDEAVGLMGGGS